MTTLSAGKKFTLTPGRPLFTGISQAHLTYSTLTDSGGVDIILKPHTRYTFDESLSGSILSGRIYFFDTLSTEKTPYSDDLIGMPILDGMKMRNLSGNFQIRDTMTNSLTEVTR